MEAGSLDPADSAALKSRPPSDLVEPSMRRLLLLVALSAPLLAQAPPAASWPQFRNTPALTGVAASPLPAALRVLWTYDTKQAVESSAAVVDGVVYVGSMSGELLALDAATGALEW